MSQAVVDCFAPKGRFEFVQFRDGVEIDRWDINNLVTNEGKDHILNTVFRAGAANTTWYMGVFQGNYTPVATVTAAGLEAAADEFVDYTPATRPTWTVVAPAAQALTNSASPATFTMTGGGTIYGAFIASANVKGGTTGVLMAIARAGTARTVLSGDVLAVTYSISA